MASAARVILRSAQRAGRALRRSLWASAPRWPIDSQKTLLNRDLHIAAKRRCNLYILYDRLPRGRVCDHASRFRFGFRVEAKRAYESDREIDAADRARRIKERAEALTIPAGAKFQSRKVEPLAVTDWASASSSADTSVNFGAVPEDWRSGVFEASARVKSSRVTAVPGRKVLSAKVSIMRFDEDASDRLLGGVALYVRRPFNRHDCLLNHTVDALRQGDPDGRRRRPRRQPDREARVSPTTHSPGAGFLISELSARRVDTGQRRRLLEARRAELLPDRLRSQCIPADRAPCPWSCPSLSVTGVVPNLCGRRAVPIPGSTVKR